MPNRLTGAVLAANPNMKLNETPREALARVIGKDCGPWCKKFCWPPKQAELLKLMVEPKAASEMPGLPPFTGLLCNAAHADGGLLLHAFGAN